jgi:CO dehydrogenase maturation factor
MKIAVIGKGGSGKTTTSGILSRELARRGREVIALDCDTNANLGLSLGMGVDVAEHLVSVREQLDAGEAEHATTPMALLERFGRDGPDGVRFVVVARIENPNPGCPCCGMSPHQLLDQLDAPGRVVIADLEAGIETLTRVGEGAVDVAVLVVEASMKSLDVGERALDLARERGVERIVVVANRIQHDDDLTTIAARFPDLEVVAVPEDPVVVRADRDGLAPIDVEGTAPAVRAIATLADRLGERQPIG